VRSCTNVLSVGVGTKQVKGELTETWCVSVLVRAKRSPGVLPSGGVVPPDVDGIPTDVVESGELGPLMIDPKDKRDGYDFVTYRPLRGGIKRPAAVSRMDQTPTRPCVSSRPEGLCWRGGTPRPS